MSSSNPPSAVVPSPFIHSTFISQEVIIISATCLALMVMFVAVRMGFKARNPSTFGWDDYTSVFAMIGATGFTSIVIVTTKHLPTKISRQSIEAVLSTFTERMQLLAIFYNPVCFFAKLSLYLLYLRAFAPSRRTSLLIYIGIAFTAMFHLAFMLSITISCAPKPGESYLESTATHHCTQAGIVGGIVQSAINIVIDFYILCIPMPVVWSLRLPTQQKIGVSAIFMTGLLACTASILSLYYRVELKESGDNVDTSALMVLMMVVEINIGIICSCMPAFAASVRDIVDKLVAISSRRFKSSNPSRLSGGTLIPEEKSDPKFNLLDDHHCDRDSMKGSHDNRLTAGLAVSQNSLENMESV